MYLEKSSTTTASSECTSYASSSSASNLGQSSLRNEFQNVAGTSRMEYGLTTFLDYNEQRNLKKKKTFNVTQNLFLHALYIFILIVS